MIAARRAVPFLLSSSVLAFSFRKTSKSLIRIVTAILVLCVCLPAMHSQQTTQKQVLQHHVRPAVTNHSAAFRGELSGETQMQLAVILPLRNQDVLTSLLQRLYDPASPDYRHFLSVAQFTDQFGPTAQDYAAVAAYMQSYGLNVDEAPANRLVVSVSGSVTQINAAFNVQMNTYQHPTENRTFYSPDREPSLRLNVPVAHVSGLDSYSLPHHFARRRSEASQAAPFTVNGSGPGSSYLGSDMRAVYYGGTTLDGTGQSLALLEFGGYDPADVALTFSNAGQTTNVPINNVLLNGATTGSGTGDGEQVLDIVQAIGMAPGLSQVRVYIGPSGVVSDASILNSIATENIAKQISCSWGWLPADPTTDDVFFQEMATQGQSFFTASGDDGAFDAQINPFFYPAEDQYVTAVGGTHLTTSGPAGTWVSETVWNSPDGNINAGSGGGVSPDGIALPSYQSGLANSANGGSGTLRNVPDVAMEGDFDNYACQAGVCNGDWAGTSFAAPRWAGFMALINQQAIEAGTAPAGGIGFLNTPLYTIAQGTNASSDLHDIVSGNNDTDNQPVWFSAVAGYDLTTGWGSANGQSLINDLAGPQIAGYWLSSSQRTLDLNPGGTGTATIKVTDAGGFTGSVNLAVTSTLPSGVTASFASSSATTSDVLTFSVDNSVTQQNLPVTITGTSGSLSETTSLTLAVHTPTFALTTAPSGLTITPGGTTSATVTVTPEYGFTGTVSLATSGLPSGVTASFSPATTSGTSTLTLTANSSVTASGATLTITGTSGSITSSEAVALTVATPQFKLLATSLLSVGQGSSASGSVEIEPLYGFTGNVTLAISGLPAGVTAAFSTNPTTSYSSITFTASSMAAVESGAVVTITGTSGSLTATTSLTLNVMTPTFTLSTSGAIAVGQGHSGSTYVYVNEEYGFIGNVNLSISGLPTGVTAVFSTNPTTNSSMVTFTASPTATVRASTVTITGTSGSLTATTSFTLNVMTPTFALSTSSVAAVGQGSSISPYVYVNEEYGFSGNVNLSISGLPTGVTAVFSTNPTTSSSMVTFTASPTAAVESGAVVTITGTSGSVTATTSLTLNVMAPTFTLSTSGLATVGQGTSTSAYAYVSGQYGFSGNVNLSISGLPAGVTAVFSTNPTTYSSTVTFTASPTAAVESGAVVTITGTSGSITATTSLTLNVMAPTFTLSSSGPATVGQGSSISTYVNVNGQYGFSGNVNLSIAGLPAGVTAVFSTNPTTNSSTVTFTASPTAAVESGAVVTITGISGSVRATTSITLNVMTPTFTLSGSSAVTVGQGSSTGPIYTYVNAAYGFSGNVSLSISGLPAGVTALWETNPITITPPTASSAAGLYLYAASSAAVGPYTLTITGTSGNVKATTTMTLTVAAPTFSLAAYNETVGQGLTGAGSVYVNEQNGFSGNVNLSISGLPSGVTATFSPASTTYSSNILFTVGSSVPVSSYLLTITGTSGSLTETASMTLTVAAPTFTLYGASSPTIGQGFTGSEYVYVEASNGFNSAVNLSISGLPSGVTASFSPASTTYSSTILFTVGNSVPAGQYPLTITGTSGSLTATTPMTLTVGVPAFSLTAPSPTVGQGSTGTGYVYVNAQNGFSGNVNLSISGLPSGVTATFSPASTTYSSSILFTVGSTVPAGQYPLTVTGTSGSLTETTPMTLTVGVPTFTLYSASSPTIGQGSTGSGFVYLEASNGFNSAVNLSISGLPSGVAASFSPASTTYSSTILFTVGNSVPAGQYPLTITGTSGSLTQATTMTLTVAVPTFSMSGQYNVSLNQGGNATASIGITFQYGFTGNVALSASGLPNGVTGSFSSNPATTTGSTLTLSANSTVTPGTYAVTVTGTSGSITQTTPIQVTVNTGGFSLTAMPNQVLVTPGTSGRSTIAVVPVYGFVSGVSLVASGLPAGVTATFSPATATTSSTMTLTASAATVVGNANITITGTSGTETASVPLVLTVRDVGTATSTTLSLASSGSGVTTVPSGTAVTATVGVSAGLTPITAGQAYLCDARSTYCDSVHQLATAQLNNKGNATFQFIPGIGARSYKAAFSGTVANAGSSSTSVSLTVTGTLSSATTLVQSGTAGNYTLTATVTGQGDVSPTGNISFVDTSANNAVLASVPLASSSPTMTQSLGQTMAMPGSPYVMVVADFNGDGIPDLAISDSVAYSVSILLGSRNGTFSAGSTLQVGSVPKSIAVGDFNRDGKIDLAVVLPNSSTVAILLGNGDGTFTMSTSTVYTLPQASNIVAADFNGDGLLDLAIMDQSTGTITIQLGHGDGTFSPSSYSPSAGTGPQVMVQADFNGDGVPDLAITNGFYNGSVTILLGNGDGTFTSAPLLATAGYPYSIVVNDFDNDGKPDLAIAFSESSGLSIFLGNGDGTFKPATNYLAGGFIGSLVSADLNGDGNQDLIAQNMTVTTTLLGKGDGTFTAGPTEALTWEPAALAVGDWNGDGTPDIAVLNNFFNPSLTTYTTQRAQKATATLTNASPYGNGPHAIDAAYPGDSSYAASTSSTVSLTAAAGPTTVSVTPTSSTLMVTQPLTVNVAVAATVAKGYPAPTGSVVLTSGSYTSPAVTPTGGAASIQIPATTLSLGSDTLTVTYTPDPAGSVLYQGATGTATVTVTKTTPTITWAAPSAITYGTPLSGTQLNATASTNGTFSYNPATGVVLPAVPQTLMVTFTPADTTNYQIATSTVPLTVNTAPLSISANNVSRVYGVANPSLSGTMSPTVNGDIFTESYSTTATASSAPGTYVILPAVSGANLADYTVSATNGTLTVSTAPTTTSLALSNQNLTLTASVTSTSSGTPTGTVTFYAGQTQLGTGTLNNGTATTTLTSFPTGDVSLSAQYGGDSNFATSTSASLLVVAVAPTSSSLTVTTAGTITDNLNVTVPSGYSGTLQFSCTGLPQYATCSFQPSSITFSGSTTTGTTVLTIGTGGLAQMDRAPLGDTESHAVRWAAVFALPGLLTLLAARRRRLSSHLRILSLVLMLLGASAWFSGCGGSGSSGGGGGSSSTNQTPAGTYTIQLVATGAAGVSQSTPITLTVH